MSKWTEKIYTICVWVTRLAYLNFLWFFFTFIGFIVLGGFPASAGLFAVIRKWIRGTQDMSIFHEFWISFKKSFISANTLGYLFLLIGFILYMDLRFFHYQDGPIYQVIFYTLLAGTLFYILTFLFLFPVFVHYDSKGLQYIKQSFMIMILSPMQTLSMLSGTFIVGYIMYRIPGLIPFYGVSLIALIVMWFAYAVFIKIEQKS